MNVVLITLDCARADWLACNGGSRHLAPEINRLAEQGVTFKNAITASNTTAPSHVSILTSTYSPSHGVKGNGIVFDCSQIPTLAQVLSAHKVTTAAFVSVEHLSSFFGLSRGFRDYYNNSSLDNLFYKAVMSKSKFLGRSLLEILEGLRRRSKIFGAHSKKGGETLKQAVKWLRLNHSRDFFIWVHLFDAHNHRTRTEYDEKIHYVDAQVGKLLAQVYRYCSPDEVFVTIVGDHGEVFREEWGFAGHGTSLRDEVTKVPLVLALPGKVRPKIVQEQVRTIDIAPTILDLYNIKIPNSWQGISLYPFLSGKQPFRAFDALTYSYTIDLHAKCITTPKWKMIYFNELANYANPAYGKDGIGHAHKIELYNIEKDKAETNNLAQDNEQIIKELKARFFDLESRSSRIYSQEDFNPVIKKRLKDLGYL